MISVVEASSERLGAEDFYLTMLLTLNLKIESSKRIWMAYWRYISYPKCVWKIRTQMPTLDSKKVCATFFDSVCSLACMFERAYYYLHVLTSKQRFQKVISFIFFCLIENNQPLKHNKQCYFSSIVSGI